jgi:hypothetical protein
MDTQELIRKVTEKLNRIRDLVDQVRDKINGLLDAVPFFLKWIVSKIEGLWDKFCNKMEEFWNWFTDKLAYAGDPFLLKETGQKWTDQLGKPTHQRFEEVDSDDLLVDDNWRGTAASAYKEKIGGQKDALNAVGRIHANPIQSALNTMKTGIWIFWIGIASALAALILGVIAGLAAEGTIIGIPAGLFAQIAAVIAFLLAAGGATAALKLSCDDAAQGLRNLNTYANKWPSFALD